MSDYNSKGEENGEPSGEDTNKKRRSKKRASSAFPNREVRYEELTPPKRQPVRLFLDEHPGCNRDYLNAKASTAAFIGGGRGEWQVSEKEKRPRSPEWTIDENRGQWHMLTSHPGVHKISAHANTPPFYAPLFRPGVALEHLCGDFGGCDSGVASRGLQVFRSNKAPRHFRPWRTTRDQWRANPGCAGKETATRTSSLARESSNKISSGSHHVQYDIAGATTGANVNNNNILLQGAGGGRSQQRAARKPLLRYRKNIEGVHRVLRATSRSAITGGGEDIHVSDGQNHWTRR
ncbi:unnamed protein product [Amoebophrya sp. A25]|nr:unnamed protein product [Amoebophrya sp. A25]|eukprot:GSA25T00026125001.1